MRPPTPMHALHLGVCVSAFAIRDNVSSNGSSMTILGPILSDNTIIGPWTTEITSTSTRPVFFKPHPESTVSGFEAGTSTTGARDPSPTISATDSAQDIGHIIVSFLETMVSITLAVPVPTFHDESTMDGFETHTPSETGTPMYDPSHLESSANGFNEPIRSPSLESPKPLSTQYLNAFSSRITQLLAMSVITPPAITQHGLTLQPVAVTATRPATEGDRASAVANNVGYQYVVDSVTLPLDTPTTINGVLVAVTTDSSSHTILIAGEMTTTLPTITPSSLTPWQSSDIPAAISIATTVIEGSTKYIVASQTLAPGQPITVNDIPVSIAKTDGATILVVGDMTTTLAGSSKSSTTTEWGPSTAAPPGDAALNRNTEPKSTSKTAEVAQLNFTVLSLAIFTGIATLILVV